MYVLFRNEENKYIRLDREKVDFKIKTIELVGIGFR